MKNIMSTAQRQVEADEFCTLCGLDGRQEAVFAEIHRYEQMCQYCSVSVCKSFSFAPRILERLRKQIETSSTARKKFIDIYSLYFPSWDPCAIKDSVPTSIDDPGGQDRHPPLVIDDDGLKVRHYMIKKRDNGGFYKVAECAYACFSEEECTCPDGCVFVTVTRVLPQTDDEEPLDQIDFQPSEYFNNLLRCDLQFGVNI